MRLDADFSAISTDFEPVPADTYRVQLEDIEEGQTQENKLPQLKIVLEITEGPFQGRKLFDWVTLSQKNGKRNDIGYGRVKAYAVAILGEEQGNGQNIDTDELKGGTCDVVVELESYVKKDKATGQQIGEGKRNEIKKVLPAA